jgi:hypothetical protein
MRLKSLLKIIVEKDTQIIIETLEPLYASDGTESHPRLHLQS